MVAKYTFMYVYIFKRVIWLRPALKCVCYNIYFYFDLKLLIIGVDETQAKQLCLYAQVWPLCAVSGMWRFLFFLLSSVRQLWVTATFLWSSTAEVKMGRRSVLWSCSSLVTRLTCGKQYATFGTDSQRVRSTPWVRALVQDSCCPTWASAAPPATWRLQPACLQFSAARAGLRVARPGRSTGLLCFTKKSASAGRVIGRILFFSLSSKYLSLCSGLFINGL